MTRYIIRRAMQSFALLFMTTLIAFSIQQLAPGGPLQFLDDDPSATSADLTRLERLYGLDRTISAQYLAWMTGEDWLPESEAWRSGRCLSEPERCGKGILRLDFGRSFHWRGESVIDLIAERIPASLQLALASLLISNLIGIPLGIISAFRRGRWEDNTIRVTTVMASTVPSWWIGLLLLIFLGSYLKIVPLGGMHDIDNDSLLNRLHHIALPALVLATGGIIGTARILRFEILEVLNQDYVRTARAKGLSKRTVIVRHVLRNSLLPFVTGLSGLFLIILSGSILFENVFAWPGMGRLAVQAINARDYPLMMAFFVIGGFLSILGLLFVDIMYSIVDPRVTYKQSAG